ncbi:MAG TPA: hypothetical protein VN397_02785 [Candidatus Methylomirabilis sp.]|nr:hypothetical protein [Candidatus Methylomirabilis sp.]
MKKTLLLTAAVVVALGAGCADRFKPAAQPQSSAIQQAFQSSTTTFGNVTTTASPSSVTSTKPVVRWDKTEIPWRRVGFTPPTGYWAYSAQGSQAFEIVPGLAPAPGSPDPKIDVFTRRVAEFYTIERDKESFPTWERFELTMAQFACASGDTDETFVTCTDKAANVTRGTLADSLTYVKFTLPSFRKKDKAPMGNHTYFVVRLGPASDHGILVAVLNEKTGVSPTWSLVKSMRMK